MIVANRDNADMPTPVPVKIIIITHSKLDANGSDWSRSDRHVAMFVGLVRYFIFGHFPWRSLWSGVYLQHEHRAFEDVDEVLSGKRAVLRL